jgi:hypothetical protein
MNIYYNNEIVSSYKLYSIGPYQSHVVEEVRLFVKSMIGYYRNQLRTHQSLNHQKCALGNSQGPWIFELSHIYI